MEYLLFLLMGHTRIFGLVVDEKIVKIYTGNEILSEFNDKWPKLPVVAQLMGFLDMLRQTFNILHNIKMFIQNNVILIK